jgi:hypothetical protein
VVLSLQAVSQQVGEKVVIAIPASLVVQRDDKQSAMFEMLQDGLRS